MGELIAMISGKGGTGKSLCTAALGLALSKKNKKVLLIDLVFGLRTLDLFLGTENQVVYNLLDLLKKRCEEDLVILRVPVPYPADSQRSTEPVLDFVPASQAKEIDEISADDLFHFLEEKKQVYDYIIIDAPAGYGRGMQLASEKADRILITSTLDAPSLRCSDRVISILKRQRRRNLYMLLDRVSKIEKSISFDDYRDLISIDLLGLVFESDDAMNAPEFNKIADRILKISADASLSVELEEEYKEDMKEFSETEGAAVTKQKQSFLKRLSAFFTG